MSQNLHINLSEHVTDHHKLREFYVLHFHSNNLLKGMKMPMGITWSTQSSHANAERPLQNNTGETEAMGEFFPKVHALTVGQPLTIT